MHDTIHAQRRRSPLMRMGESFLEYQERRRRSSDGPSNEPRVPVTLLSLDRPAGAADLMLEGLRNHYLESLTMGKIEAWRKAAHAMIDLMADVEQAALTRRSTLPRS